MAEKLNGLRPEKLNEILNSLKDPEVKKAISGPWRSRVRWETGFKGKAYTRTHTVDFDEPEGLDATDTAASAHEHILSAVGGCMMVGFVLNATKARHQDQRLGNRPRRPLRQHPQVGGA